MHLLSDVYTRIMPKRIKIIIIQKNQNAYLYSVVCRDVVDVVVWVLP